MGFFGHKYNRNDRIKTNKGDIVVQLADYSEKPYIRVTFYTPFGGIVRVVKKSEAEIDRQVAYMQKVFR